MTIEKSANYTSDLKSRKLFGRMHLEITALASQIENLMTATNGMRLALGAATLTLAEVEALHVQQSHEKRTNDAMLYEAETKLDEMLDAAKTKAAAVGSLIVHHVPKVQGLTDQVARIATRDVVDHEPTGLVDGVGYVDATYFRNELGCSASTVRNMIENGTIPPHDALDGSDIGRPKHVWLKHNAALVAQRLKGGHVRQKKGVAALV